MKPHTVSCCGLGHYLHVSELGDELLHLGSVLRQRQASAQLSAGDGGVVERHQLAPDEDAGAAYIQPALRTWTRENRCKTDNKVSPILIELGRQKQN